jgi:hypothetical protein
MVLAIFLAVNAAQEHYSAECQNPASNGRYLVFTLAFFTEQ